MMSPRQGLVIGKYLRCQQFDTVAPALYYPHTARKASYRAFCCAIRYSVQPCRGRFSCIASG